MSSATTFDPSPHTAGRSAARAGRRSQRRRLSRNDVVFRTPSGLTLIAAGPSDRSQRWFRNPIPRRSPAA